MPGKFILACVCSFLFLPVTAQDLLYRYWITFKDKDTTFSIKKPQSYLSQKAIDRRSRYGIPLQTEDLPVSNKYVEAIQNEGFEILGRSRWMNAVAVQSGSKDLAEKLAGHSFIDKVRFIGTTAERTAAHNQDIEMQGDINEAISKLEQRLHDQVSGKNDTNLYGKSYSQVHMLNAEQLHKLGLSGQGVTIAIIDAGFQHANTLPVFTNLFENGQIAGTWDFVMNNRHVYDDDDHGMAVWSCIGANQPLQLVGTAPLANYWLLRSEHTPTESLIEECYWIFAAEFADSVGADVLTSSLGYNLFDDSTFNHTLAELDGHSTLISSAAKKAAHKGMFVLSAAGNEGDNAWRYISAPADAEDILTIGGVDEKGRYSSFSSIGPTADKRIKPDVSALCENVWVASAAGTLYQGNGTSYACPLVAGIAACLVQAAPNVPAQLLIEALKESASQYYAADAFIGYGVPDAGLTLKMIGKDPYTPLNKDILLDARRLADQKVHLTVYNRARQKARVRIANLSGQQLFVGKVSLKKEGVQRLSLPKVSLKPGVYAMYLNATDGVSSILFEIK